MIAETTGVLDNITTEKLKELQIEDPGLQIPLTNRIGEPILQLVIPEKLVENILSLAHSSLLAGHTGRRRTQWRILQNFWWPRLNRGAVLPVRKKEHQNEEQCFNHYQPWINHSRG